jgi:Ca-activated chloride channel family protein
MGLALAQFSSGVSLVEVYVTASDSRGDAVRGLSREDFDVFEDGVPQQISTFVAAELPLAVAVALDRSWSMAGRPLALARSAAHTFVGQLRPDDRAIVLAIGNGVEALTPLTSDRTVLHGALQGLEPWGTTSLHDAAIAAVDRLEPEQGRRALVLLSDGVDRYSRATETEVLTRVRASDVLLYPVALARDRPPLFAELAAVTGGRSFHLRDPKLLEQTFTSIARELRQQYLLGYTPTRPVQPGAAEWRAIEVRVRQPGVTVRARNGYQAR